MQKVLSGITGNAGLTVDWALAVVTTANNNEAVATADFDIERMNF